MEEEMKVIIARVIKTKKEPQKVIVSLLIPQANTEYVKGTMNLDNWFENVKIFDNITPEDMLIPLKAKYKYEPSYNGTARMKFTEIIGHNGTNILA